MTQALALLQQRGVLGNYYLYLHVYNYWLDYFDLVSYYFDYDYYYADDDVVSDTFLLFFPEISLLSFVKYIFLNSSF